MANVSEFLARFPEFEDILDLRIQLFLDDAALLMSSEAKWLDFYDVAHLQLRCIILQLLYDGQITIPLTSITQLYSLACLN